MKNKLRKKNGFTLIEVMVVISVIGILAASFGTSVTRKLPDYRFSKYLREVQGTLQNARLIAVKSKADVFLRFDKDNNTFEVYLDNVDDEPNRGFRDPGDALIMAPETPSGVVFTELFGTEDTEAETQFNTRGFLGPRVGQIRMKNASKSCKGVDLTLGGNSRIIKSGDEWATWQ